MEKANVRVQIVKRREEIKLYAQRRKRPGCDESNNGVEKEKTKRRR